MQSLHGLCQGTRETQTRGHSEVAGNVRNLRRVVVEETSYRGEMTIYALPWCHRGGEGEAEWLFP